MQQVVALSAVGLDLELLYQFFYFLIFFLSLVLTRKAREMGVTGGEGF
jgi:hypothetical protein